MPRVYLFAGHSMAIHGGGSTCAQISRAYSRAGYDVVYISPDSVWGEESGIVEIPSSKFFATPWLDLSTERDILHIGLPCKEASEMLQSFEGHKLYHCRDNWDIWAQGKQKKIWAWYQPGLEEELINQVDISYAVSPKLMKEKGTTKLLNSGYDPNIFSWVEHVGPVRTVVIWGFSGGFVNNDLLGELIAASPSLHYILIGNPLNLDPAVVFANNTEITGEVPVTELPEYAKRADIGLIVRRGAVAEFMDPIKAWEYLGAGLRFVSVGVSYPTREYNPACIVPKSNSVDNVLESIYNSYEIIPELTHKQAEQHTWDRRVEMVLKDLGV